MAVDGAILLGRGQEAEPSPFLQESLCLMSTRPVRETVNIIDTHSESHLCPGTCLLEYVHRIISLAYDHLRCPLEPSKITFHLYLITMVSNLNPFL